MMKGMGGNRKLNKQMREDDEGRRHGHRPVLFGM